VSTQSKAGSAPAKTPRKRAANADGEVKRRRSAAEVKAIPAKTVPVKRAAKPAAAKAAPKVERTLASSDAEVSRWIERQVSKATKDGGKRPGVAALLAAYRAEGRKCSQERFRSLAAEVSAA
jgi:hypothetical protein